MHGMFSAVGRWSRHASPGEIGCCRRSRGLRRSAGSGERLAQALPHALRVQLLPERHKRLVMLLPLVLAIVVQGENARS